ncbi:potassium voltage-gated subfamily H(eag-related) member [Raphidocelis subcapitata]|uniref:Potassium voltage-gated subfamily H(Eag-related) member n=1 Tax=Raphidocelis subcapitata TaxID=307507 RepID=A0A2V0P7X9_9CHLO|nr:potassium voltage-gated subfamily H(eag-related) member [Raphidocelis subcapitata]|eukprot:GBF93983.1 potassium voltage-gated subfamily H(eag-related) member [Raphidocelis subcapitata]
MGGLPSNEENHEANLEKGPVQPQPQPQPQKEQNGCARCGARIAARLARAALWDVLDPRGPFHKCWDSLLLAQLAYLIVQVPFVVCFGIQYRPRDAMGSIEIIVDATFAIDVLVNFRTGLWDEETQTVNSDRTAIARAYARGWLVPDVLSALPYEWFLMGAANVAARVVKLVRVLRVVKLVKLRRSSLLLQHIAYALGPSLLQLLKLCLGAALLAHFIACIFYGAAHINREDSNWVRRYGIHDASVGYKYLTSLYFTVSTLSTVGFGDVSAASDGERVVAIFAVLLGLTVFASFVSSVSRLLGDMDGPEAKARQRLQQLGSFLSQRKVPRALLRRIAEHQTAASLRQLSADELALIDELSTPLRTELVLFLFAGVLDRLPFFHSKPPSFTAAVVTHLRLEYAEPGDVVMRQGESGDSLYFVAEGELDVHVDRALAEPAAAAATAAKAPPAAGAGAGSVAGSPSVPMAAAGAAGRRGSGSGALGVLRAGDVFGEYSTLLGQRRSATVVAAAPCELWSLSRASLCALLGRWPELLPDFEGMLQVQPGAGGGGGKRGRVVVPGGVLGQVVGGEGVIITARDARSRLREMAACARAAALQRGGAASTAAAAGGAPGGAAAGAGLLRSSSVVAWQQWLGEAAPAAAQAAPAAGGACRWQLPSTAEEPSWPPRQQRARSQSLPGGGPAEKAPPATRSRGPSLRHDFGSLNWREGGSAAEAAAAGARRASRGAGIGRSSMPLLRPTPRMELPRTGSVQESILAAEARANAAAAQTAAVQGLPAPVRSPPGGATAFGSFAERSHSG